MNVSLEVFFFFFFSIAAKDASEDFEDIGHSRDAREMLEDYLIGEIDPATISVKEKAPITFASQAHKVSSSPSMKLVTMLKYLTVPVAIIFFAITVRYLTTKKSEP